MIDKEQQKIIIEEGVQSFLSNNSSFNINARDRFGAGLLSYIKDIEDIDFLVDKGINVNNLDNEGKNVLFYLDDINLVKKFIEVGVNVNVISNRGKTPITTTTSKEVIEYLFKKGAIINVEQLLKRLPYESKDICLTLLNAFNINNFTDEEKQKIIFNSIENFEALLALKKYGFKDFNVKDSLGNNALSVYVSICNSSVRGLSKLINFGFDYKVTNNNGQNLLFMAGNKKIFEYLIKLGLDIEKRDDTNGTILHYNDNVEVLRSAIKLGLKADSLNKNQQVPFLCSYNEKASKYLFDKLIETKPYTFHQYLNLKYVLSDDKRLSWVANYCFNKKITLSFEQLQLKQLYEGYSLDIKEKQFKYIKKINLPTQGTDFSILTGIKNVKDFEKAVKYFNLDINHIYKNGQNILHRILYLDQHKPEIVKYLLDSKIIDINKQDYKGNSPIFYLKKKSLLSYFIDSNVNFNIKNNDDKKCIDYIKENSFYISEEDKIFIEDSINACLNKSVLEYDFAIKNNSIKKIKL